MCDLLDLLKSFGRSGKTLHGEVCIGDVEHAILVDLSLTMLALGPQGNGPARARLVAPIVCDVTLIFGEPEQNEDETYVPLLVQEVSPASALLDRIG